MSNLLSLIQSFARTHDTFPTQCPIGQELQHIMQSFAGEPLLVVYQYSLAVLDGEPCYDVQSCWECPRGIELLHDLIEEATHVSFPESVLETLGSIYTSQGSARGTPRTLAPDCPIGKPLNSLDPNIRVLVPGEGCWTYSSCSQCAYRSEHIEDLILDVVQEGWEGSAGLKLREDSGLL